MAEPAHELIPPGTYRTRVQKGWKCVNDKGGNPMPKLTFPVSVEYTEVKTDEKTGERKEVVFKKAMSANKNCSLNGGAKDITLRDLWTCGADPNVDAGELMVLIFKGEGGLDKNDVEIGIRHREHEGKIYNEVFFIQPVGGNNQFEVPSTVGDIEKLRLMLKGYKPQPRNNGSSNPTPKPEAAAAKAPAKPSDDEIPF